MDSIHHWLGFIAIALFVTLTPGPAVILALSNSLTYGPIRAMIGSLGNATGLVAVAITTTAGLGAILITSATAFLVLKLAGAGYLIYLGLKQWHSQGTAFDDVAQGPKGASAGKLFLKGVSVAITNPKAILFFIAFLPQFIQPGISHIGQAGVLIATFAGCSVVAHVFYVVLAQTLKPVLTGVSRRKSVNRVFGASFIALGVSLFTLKGRSVA